MTMFFSPDLYPHPGIPPPLTGEEKRDPEAKWWNVISTSADLAPGAPLREHFDWLNVPPQCTASPPGEGELRNCIVVIPAKAGIQEREGVGKILPL